MNKEYLELNKKDLCCCISHENHTIDLYNIRKSQLKKICYSLSLAQKESPDDRVLNKMLKDYKGYLEKL